ncbi:MAG: helix-turn-helix domain-containing protein [Defluviitaleaceae bacterium]|nr:helix-turn-helix domain-containing protein [Defluviitaleaceae bacterium]
MAFAERIKDLRVGIGISQDRLAKEIGTTTRTIIKYEQGHSLPSAEQLTRLSKYFSVSIDSLLTEQEGYVAEAYEKGGTKSAKKIAEITDELSGMFAGGSLSEDDLDAAMRAITQAYWIAKDINKKKYTPKRYRARQERKAEQPVAAE